MASLIAADNGGYRETLLGEPFRSPLTGGFPLDARPEGSQSVAVFPVDRVSRRTRPVKACRVVASSIPPSVGQTPRVV